MFLLNLFASSGVLPEIVVLVSFLFCGNFSGNNNGFSFWLNSFRLSWFGVVRSNRLGFNKQNLCYSLNMFLH